MHAYPRWRTVLPLLGLFADDPVHRSIAPDENDSERLVTWRGTYAHRQGAFSMDQEAQLVAMNQRYRHLLKE